VTTADSGLVHLRGLTRLTTLRYSTDIGLIHLKSLTSKKKLALGSQITDAGMKEIKAALPECRIMRDKPRF